MSSRVLGQNDAALPRAGTSLQVALITGACSGIGRALAARLASLGYELILVSQRPVELQQTATQLSTEHGVRTHALVCDLARPQAAEELYEQVTARGLHVDILISNAGFFFFGEAADASLSQANALLQLHVVTPSLLCTLWGREMRERRRGHILLVSSISAFRDMPSISYYGSSKKYLRGFAHSLRSELAVYDVNVTCLCPGATATALYDPQVVPVDLARRLGVMMDAEAVAEAGLRALFARQAECIPGRLNRVMAQAVRLLPQAVIDLARRHAPWLPPKQPPSDETHARKVGAERRVRARYTRPAQLCALAAFAALAACAALALSTLGRIANRAALAAFLLEEQTP